ncbi:MAG TPA: hypothetical protein VD710_08940 [Nitrososphaeraceae archaeon]|nr:hypothetical protein [Nitrososphaeraceae archaeon]
MKQVITNIRNLMQVNRYQILLSCTITGMFDNQQNPITDVPQNNDEIVGTYMVPARLLDKYHAQFQDKEFTIDSLILLRIYGVARQRQAQSKR